MCPITYSQEIKQSNMQALFLRKVALKWRHGFKLIALMCVIFSLKTLYESDKIGYFDTTVKGNRKDYQNRSTTNSSITLFVRMSGKLKEHRTRFYCDLFRTAVLFWPASLGKTVVVLDKESEQDHIFANNLTSQMKQHFPNRKLEVALRIVTQRRKYFEFHGFEKISGLQPPTLEQFLY